MKFDLGIVHAPIWEGQTKPGVAEGPAELEDRGLYDTFFESGYNFKVFKMNKELASEIQSQEEKFDSKAKLASSDYEDVEPKYEKVYELFLTAYDESKLPIMIGGDHSAAISSISALNKRFPKAGILWIDAHADFNTFESSPTGNIHGMPVAALSGLISKKDLFHGEWACDSLDPKQFVYLGVRDIDPGELKLLKEQNVLAYSAEELRQENLNDVFKEINEHFVHYGFTNGVHISFDIDGLSSELVPATGTPVSHGIDLDQLKEILNLTNKYFHLTSVDCVEFNPSKAKNEAELLQTYNSIQFFFTQLLTRPRFMVDRHISEEI